MSPLTLERIKKAKGKVRITTVIDESKATNVAKYAIQIMEGEGWVTVLEDFSRQACEQAVRKAASQIILG